MPQRSRMQSRARRPIRLRRQRICAGAQTGVEQSSCKLGALVLSRVRRRERFGLCSIVSPSAALWRTGRSACGLFDELLETVWLTLPGVA